MSFHQLLTSILLILLTVQNFSFAACGPIPSSYVIYSSEKIELKKDITINSAHVNANEYQPKATLNRNGQIKTHTDLNLPELEPSVFPSINSSTKLEINASTTLYYNSSVYFEEIIIDQKNISVNFTGNGPYYIKTLKTDKEYVNLNFSAGTYFIEKFEIKKKYTRINITSSPVIMHIADIFDIDGDHVSINTNGEVDDLRVYLHAGAKFESKKKNLLFTGIIYGPENINEVKIEGKDSKIRGVILVSGGKVEVKNKGVEFTNTASDQAKVNQVSTCATEKPVANKATTFNCVEPGSHGISGRLYTKTIDQNFNLDIIALKDANNIETDFASGSDHSINVELVDSSSSTNCSNYPRLSPAISQTMIFNVDDHGVKRSANFTSSRAYPSVKCRVTDSSDSPTVIGCSSDRFSIRPKDLSITSNMTNSGHSGEPKLKAGEEFSLTATSNNGYNGTPLINQAKIEAHANANVNGSINGNFNAAVNGVSTGDLFDYTEVGSFRLLNEGVYDDSFTSVDQPDDCLDNFSNTPSAGKVGCKFGNLANTDYFGRFTPDHFEIQLNTPQFQAACGSFSYLGQPIQYFTAPDATITAKSLAGTITQNYTGDYWKIRLDDLSPEYSANAANLTVLDSSLPTLIDNQDGTGYMVYSDHLTPILSLNKDLLTAEFDAEIALEFDLIDEDSIQVALINNQPGSNPVSFGKASPGLGIEFKDNYRSHRWGRLVLDNIHGSEVNALKMPVKTEYYNGLSFITNTSDNCTTFSTTSNFSISDTADFDCNLLTQNNPVVIGAGQIQASLPDSQVNAGLTHLLLSNPGNLTLGSGSGNTGYLEVTSRLSTLPWLLYDWNGDSNHNECPSARASFGIYKGNSKQIYIREIY